MIAAPPSFHAGRLTDLLIYLPFLAKQAVIPYWVNYMYFHPIFFKHSYISAVGESWRITVYAVLNSWQVY